MSYLTVTAEEIRKDDQILMGETFSKNPRHRWINVRKVKRVNHEDQDKIMVVTAHHNIMFDPGEEVAIQRWSDLNASSEELK